MAPLALLTPGDEAEVMKIEIDESFDKNIESNANRTKRMEEMGVRIGQKIKILNNNGKGPILLKVQNSRIAIGRVIAMNILVA